jgi:hypothetical protein
LPTVTVPHVARRCQGSHSAQNPPRGRSSTEKIACPAVPPHERQDPAKPGGTTKPVRHRPRAGVSARHRRHHSRRLDQVVMPAGRMVDAVTTAPRRAAFQVA